MVHLEPARKQPPPGDDPSIGARLAILAVIAILIFSVLGFRLWFLQVLSGDRYVEAAEDNRERTVGIEAPRGVIYDRNGKVMVKNRAGLSVGILPMDLKNEEKVIPRLARALGMPLEEVQAKLKEAKKDPYRVTVIKEDVAENPVVAFLKEHSLEFPGVRVEKTYVRDYPKEKGQVNSLATHLLGYVGEISELDMAKEQFRSFKPGVQIGKDGVEAQYDSYLRGVDGWRKVEVDSQGRPKRELEAIQPTPGKNLILTIDNDLQAAAEKAIAEGIQRAHADGFKDASSGAVVAIDPRNGQILAMASYPTYDPSIWVGGITQAEMNAMNAKEAHQPLLNRAIMGQYPAGSTFKPFVAATALQNGLVDTKKMFYCDGSFRLPGAVWRCWDKEGHGDVNLVDALMQSCDVYFYNLGRIFYDQKGPVLQTGVRQFGFGQTTGIPLPGEKKGRVPDKDWKASFYKNAQDKVWKTGDEVNLAIGQGDLLVTPLQLAVAFSAIANGGDIFVPRLGMRIEDSASNILTQFEVEKKGHITFTPENLEAIRRGLRLVTQDPLGTAHSAFADFSIPVAGKTGTAEKLPDDDYAWFMGYAPASQSTTGADDSESATESSSSTSTSLGTETTNAGDGSGSTTTSATASKSGEPEILVVALIEQGGHGSSVAAPVVRRVMEAYFHVKPSTQDQVRVSE